MRMEWPLGHFIPLQGWDLAGRAGWLLSIFLSSNFPTPPPPTTEAGGVRAREVLGTSGRPDKATVSAQIWTRYMGWHGNGELVAGPRQAWDAPGREEVCLQERRECGMMPWF